MRLNVADKVTQQILDALTRAAAEPAGTVLYGTKSEPGLFPATAAAKPAARKALDDGLLEVIRTETKGKQTRELAVATDQGLQFLLAQSSPKQVLEDFVRVLEEREGQIAELVQATTRISTTLAGLKSTVAMVLPQVVAQRITPNRLLNSNELPNRPAVSVNGHTTGHHPAATTMPTVVTRSVATLTRPVVAELEDLTGAILSRICDWAASATAGQDCPLPELYRSLSTREVPPSVGVFHDCLRQLHDDHRIYLHPWTGPLYALPEPAYALLVGHNIGYYASPRN